MEVAATRVEGTKARWNAHSVAKGASIAKNNLSNDLTAVSREVTVATKQKVCITGLQLKEASKRVSSQIEIEPQTTILRIRARFERDHSEKLRKGATCQAVLHNHAVEYFCSLPDTTDLVVRFDANIAVVELLQTADAVSNQASKAGAKTGGITDK